MYAFNFDIDTFLGTCWQKKPIMIKQGFKDFNDPICADELAGLAMEAEIDSRWITNANKQWAVTHGPFDDFDNFPQSHAQLVVQAANHWHCGPQELAKAFDCLPNWLFDDVMVCYSQPQGGVGPHMDQYDVFIIQGEGQRRWRVGDQGSYKETNFETGLRQIESFDAIIDDVMEAGDILYIPAGFPHEGEAITTSMSYSVGYRSPKAQELLSGFADYVIREGLGDVHYLNPAMSKNSATGSIPTEDSQHLLQMVASLLKDTKAQQRWLGEYLSQSRHELDIAEPDAPWQEDELLEILSDGEALIKLAGLRAFYHPNAPSILHVNGESFEFPEHCSGAIKALCVFEAINQETLGQALSEPVFREALTSLVNNGYWFICEE